MFQLNVLFILTVFSGCYCAADIRKYLKVCDRNALDVNDCMTDAIQQGIAAMIDGIPDLNVPPIDPYLQKDFRLDYKNNQMNGATKDSVPYKKGVILCNNGLMNFSNKTLMIAAKMILKDIYVEGMKLATVHDARLRADDDKFHLEVDLTNPQVVIKAEYYGEGQFNALKILAHGTVNTTMTDLTYTWKLDGVPEKNGSETYIRIKDFYMRPDVGNMVTTFMNENLESKELTDLGTRFANENWRTLYREFLPFAQANWNKIGVRIANKIFLKVPYNQLFPSSS